jgi:hypothetical protein
MLALITHAEMSSGYERDVHLGVTVWLAEMAGFKVEEAYELSRQNEAVDYDPSTEPGTEDLLRAFSEAAKQRRAEFHFVSPQRLDKLRESAKTCSRGAITQVQYRRFGQYLHALQDRHSHDGYYPDSGHLRDGRGPDKPWSPATDRDPKRTVRMIEDTYTALRDLQATCSGSTRPAADFRQTRQRLIEWADDEIRNRPLRGRGDSSSAKRWNDVTRELYGMFHGEKGADYIQDRINSFAPWLNAQRIIWQK